MVCTDGITLPLWAVPPGVSVKVDRETPVNAGRVGSATEGGAGSGIGGDAGSEIEGGAGRHIAGARVVLQYPRVTPELIQRVAAAVETGRCQWLAHLRTAEVVDLIDRAVQLWLDPEYPLRQMAERLLPVITGYDAETVRLELKRLLRTFRKKELLRFLDEDFGNPAVLDEFRPALTGGLHRAYGPRLLVHVLSGNVPGLSVWSVVMGLLVKAANVAKPSSSEPLMPVLFARSLSQVEPRFAHCLAVLPWKGGADEVESRLFAMADAVVAYGSDQVMARLARLVPPGVRLLGYGHKVSFAMVGREALTADLYADTCHRLAGDICVYDQQSCMSPQVVFVEQGGAISPDQFAALLAAEMQRYEVRRPRGALTEDEAVSIRAFRSRYEFASLRGEDVRLFASPEDTAWTVVYHGSPGFEPTPLNRTVHVYGCATLEEAVGTLAAWRPYLQSAGLAVLPARLLSLADQLGACGVSRIAAIGQMTRAAAGWHHDGRPNLADLVRWVDIEPAAERAAERYDADVE